MEIQMYLSVKMVLNLQQKFKAFQTVWHFEHITSSPNSPQSNGGVERAVQKAKLLMKKAMDDNVDPHVSLLNHRNTPRDTVFISPALRLMSKQTKTLLHIAEERRKPEVKILKLLLINFIIRRIFKGKI